MVLLKNDGVLPLKRGAKVAVFGKAQVDHVTGVHIKFSTTFVCNILEGLLVTDWSNQAHQGKSICAGNDVRMPIGFFDQADEYLRIWSYDNGMAYIQACARRVLELLIKLN